MSEDRAPYKTGRGVKKEIEDLEDSVEYFHDEINREFTQLRDDLVDLSHHIEDSVRRIEKIQKSQYNFLIVITVIVISIACWLFKQ